MTVGTLDHEECAIIIAEELAKKILKRNGIKVDADIDVYRKRLERAEQRRLVRTHSFVAT
jgi:pyrimidine operon attenuation protein/uracil phosphoribosyltransferase